MGKEITLTEYGVMWPCYTHGLDGVVIMIHPNRNTTKEEIVNMIMHEISEKYNEIKETLKMEERELNQELDELELRMEERIEHTRKKKPLKWSEYFWTKSKEATPPLVYTLTAE